MWHFVFLGWILQKQGYIYVLFFPTFEFLPIRDEHNWNLIWLPVFIPILALTEAMEMSLSAEHKEVFATAGVLILRFLPALLLTKKSAAYGVGITWVCCHVLPNIPPPCVQFLWTSPYLVVKSCLKFSCSKRFTFLRSSRLCRRLGVVPGPRCLLRLAPFSHIYASNVHVNNVSFFRPSW